MLPLTNRHGREHRMFPFAGSGGNNPSHRPVNGAPGPTLLQKLFAGQVLMTNGDLIQSHP